MYEIYGIYHATYHKIIYVGQTSRTSQARFAEHLRYAYASNSDIRLYSYMRQFSLFEFGYYILETVQTRQEADEAEKKWIAFYNTYLDGYNSTLGGAGSATINDMNKSAIYNDYMNYTDINTLGKRYSISNSQIINVIKQQTGWRKVPNRLKPPPWQIVI